MKMTKDLQSIEKEVKSIVLNIFKNTTASELSLDTDLNDIGLDSLNAIQLIVQLEETFDITIDDDELLYDNYDTVSKIIEIVNQKRMITE
jgi:acyl carrier protein